MLFHMSWHPYLWTLSFHSFYDFYGLYRAVAVGPVSLVSTGPLFPSPMAYLASPISAIARWMPTQGPQPYTWHLETCEMALSKNGLRSNLKIFWGGGGMPPDHPSCSVLTNTLRTWPYQTWWLRLCCTTTGSYVIPCFEHGHTMYIQKSSLIIAGHMGQW